MPLAPIGDIIPNGNTLSLPAFLQKLVVKEKHCAKYIGLITPMVKQLVGYNGNHQSRYNAFGKPGREGLSSFSTPPTTKKKLQRTGGKKKALRL